VDSRQTHRDSRADCDELRADADELHARPVPGQERLLATDVAL
jgi:hypothetical protein